MEKYQEVAETIRRRIDTQVYGPGAALPKIAELMTEFGMSRTPVREALKLLADEGLLVLGRGMRPTTVRATHKIRIPFSRYGSVMQPGGTGGPWETACSEQGLVGTMRMLRVDTRPIGQDDAILLGVPPGADVVYRKRHACVGEEILQVQQAWYPIGIATQAGLDSQATIRGGIYGALTAAGLPPAAVDETIRARMPTRDEAELMRTGTGVPLLTVERITRDTSGVVLELLRVTAPADRMEFTYNDLPLQPVA